jgi:hypothetical protein
MKLKSLFWGINKPGTTIIFLIVFFVFSACEKTSIEPEANFFDIQGENGFVGTVEGTNAFVSILLGEERGIAYVCNGDEDIAEWFNGSVSDLKEVNFTNAKGAVIKASFINNSFEGEVSLRDGRKFLFKAEVNNNIYGGIYRVLGEDAVQAEIEAGWIVKTETDQRGSFRFRNVSQPTTTLSKSKMKDISDGTSNTIAMGERSFSFFRYKVKTPAPPAPFAPVPYPNIK